MSKNNIGELVIKSIFIGLVSGFIGLVLTAVLVDLIFGRLDLFGSIMYALIGGFLSMLISIGILVYKFFVRNDKK